jgi:hypothetical protein
VSRPTEVSFEYATRPSARTASGLMLTAAMRVGRLCGRSRQKPFVLDTSSEPSRA